MKSNEIAKIRLASQQIMASRFTDPGDLLGWMGALQAQDAAMAKWAVGVRLPGATEAMVDAALDRGEILRTHLLRPTWHLVSAQDIRWMLVLSAAQIKARLRSRHKGLGLSEAVIEHSTAVIETALRAGAHLTRQELFGRLEKAGFDAGDNRYHHLVLYAELNGVVCSGAQRDGKPTYALFEQRVPKTAPIRREEALAKLARTYFTSRCPATVQDFVWWSGLSAGEARQGLELVKAEFVSEGIAGETYWFPNGFAAHEENQENVVLLPAFDEFIISYRDRRAVLLEEVQGKAISSNGVFRPVVVRDGQVIGLWKRERARVGVELFGAPGEGVERKIEEAAGRYGRFLEREMRST